MFHRGEESLATLANLVSSFRKRRTSFLSESMITDVELFEASLDQPEPPDPGPSLIEETAEVSLLKTIVEQLQANNHYSANRPGKPDVKRVPRPKTAESIYLERLGMESFRTLEASIVYVDQEQFDRTIAEHREG